MADWVKGYTDSDGKTCTLWQMVKTEPEWAVNRIQEGEKAIAEVERLTAVIRTRPHGTLCEMNYEPGGTCDCWKAEAVRGE